MKYFIVVTDKNIKQGKKGSNYSCPIAHACRDAGLKRVDVAWNIFHGRGPVKKKLSMPQKALDFIDRFDSGKKVKPFSFMAVEKAS